MSFPDLDPRLQALTEEHCPAWLLVIDRQYSIVFANRAFAKAFGESIATPCYELLKGRESPCEPCVAAEAIAAEAPRSADEQGVAADGRPRRYRVQAVPFASDGSAVERIFLWAIDDTRAAELAEQLGQAERLASVGLTTAGLAHAIKNILAGLEGGMYMMTSGLEREDTRRIAGAWEMVEKYIEQVSSLVQNMLSYAKAERPERETVAPADLIDEMLELYQSRASMIGIVLERDVADSLPPVVIDRKGMHGCLANLVANALDACAWDPSSDKEHAIQLRAQPRHGGGVAFEIADNGMGIRQENQRKLLRAMFTTKGIRGTGLGLLLTKKVVEEHDGTLSFVSTPGEGTTFRIELPGR